MLHLILGRIHKYKHQKIVDLVKQSVDQNKETILIVPEQFSFESQRQLIDFCGVKISNQVDVLSFSGICREISKSFGGICDVVVDEGMKFLLLSKVLRQLKNELAIYSKFCESDAFCKQIIPIIAEFKQNNITSDDLKKCSESVDNFQLSLKLSDLALVLKAYNAFLNTALLDTDDIITKTIDRVKTKGWFKNKTVVIDSFKGFTGSQYELLKLIIAECDDVYININCDEINKSQDDFDIFSNIKNSAIKLIQIAKENNVSLSVEKSETQTDKFSVLEQLLSGNQMDDDFSPGDINIATLKNNYEEIEFVFSKIKYLVMNEGYRFKDFYVIARQIDDYDLAISHFSKEFQIPCFYDNKIALKNLPLTIYISSLLSATINLTRENILRFIKCGLSGLTEQEILEIENYTYIWDIENDDWLTEWTRSPNGLNGTDATKDEAALNKLNVIREKAISPILKFRGIECATYKQISIKIYELLKSENIIGKLKLYAENLMSAENESLSNIQSDGYSLILACLDKLSLFDENELKTIAEFKKMFDGLIDFQMLGEIPDTNDQVHFGSADRVRPLRPKVVFVIGANTGVFPRSVESTGLISVNDRSQMIESGIEINDSFLTKIIDEKYLFYYSCTCCIEKLFLLSVKEVGNGEPSEMNAYLKYYIDNFQNTSYFNSSDNKQLEDWQLSNEVSVMKNYTLNSEINEVVKNSLRESLLSINEYKQRILSINNYGNEVHNISQENMNEFLGDTLRISPSKIEKYFLCDAQFFFQYCLKLSSIEKVELNARVRGNVLHYILEYIFVNYPEKIGYMSKQEISCYVELAKNKYFEELNIKLGEFDSNFTYILGLMTETAEYIVSSLNNEFSVSKFRPIGCEITVHKTGEISPLSVSDGQYTVEVTGKIDRVDVDDDGNVRVVDYKSGSTKFVLSDIYSGVNLQMLIYLYAIIKNGNGNLKDLMPAGVLYFPAVRTYDSAGFSDYIKMNGLIVSEEKVIRNMEQSADGKIVPASITKKGTVSLKSSVASREDFDVIFKYIDKLLISMAKKLKSGKITTKPKYISEYKNCDKCQFQSICRFEKEVEAQEDIGKAVLEKIRLSLEMNDDD